MTEHLYTIIHIAEAVLMFFMGFHLAFANIPSSLKEETYGRSQRYMSVAVIALGAMALTNLICTTLQLSYYYQIAINLTAFFIASNFINLSISAMLGYKIKSSSKEFKLVVAYCIIYPIPIWSAILWLSKEVLNVVLITTNGILALFIAAQILYFILRHNAVINQMPWRQSKIIQTQLRWINKIAIPVCIMGVIYCATPFLVRYSMWVGIACTICSLILFIYIYETLIKLMSSLIKIVEADNVIKSQLQTKQMVEDLKKEEIEEVPTININVDNHIAKHLRSWILNRGYTKVISQL